MFGNFWESGLTATNADPLGDDELGDSTVATVVASTAVGEDSVTRAASSKLRDIDLSAGETGLSAERLQKRYAGKVVSRTELGGEWSAQPPSAAALKEALPESVGSVQHECAESAKVPLAPRPLHDSDKLRKRKAKRKAKKGPSANELRQRRKSLAVCSQCALSDKCVSARIHLQKAYCLAQKLPRASVLQQFLQRTDEEQSQSEASKRVLRQSMRELREATLEISLSLLSLQKKVSGNDNAFGALLKDCGDDESDGLRLASQRTDDYDSDSERVAEDCFAMPPVAGGWQKEAEDSSDGSLSDDILTAERWDADGSGKAKKKAAKLGWKQVAGVLSGNYMALMPVLCETLHEWDSKMKLVDSYYRAKRKGAAQLTLAQKMQQVATDPTPILLKMQQVSKMERLYGDSPLEEATHSQSGDESLSKAAAMDRRIAHGLEDHSYWKAATRRLEPHAFNDSAFYKRLLKEMTEIGLGASMSRALDDSKKGAKGIETISDRIEREKRLAKEAFNRTRRKMKFTIRPDMENFMAPRFTHDFDFPVTALYRSLFQ